MRRSTSVTPLALLAALLLSGTVRGAPQDPEPPAAAPVLVRAADVAVVRMHGPARLRAAFLATNVGTLLAAKESTDFWDLLRGAFRGRLLAVDPQAGPALAAVIEGLSGYAGTVTLAIATTPRADEWGGVRLEVGGALVLEPDGRTDLAALAGAVRDAVAAGPFRVVPVPLGGRPFDTIRHGDRGGLVLPTLIGDRLVAFFGEDLEAAVVPRLDGDAAPFEPDREFRTAPLAVRIDLSEFVRQHVGASREAATVDAAELARVSGLSSLRELRVLARPHGPHVEVETSVAFVPGVPRGVFGALMPDITDPPALAGLVPPATRYWTAGKLRAAALFGALVDTVAVYVGSDEESHEVRAATVRREAQGFLGLDVEKEICARLTDDCVVFGSLFGTPDAEEDVDPARIGAGDGTVLFAFGVREPAALEDAVARLFTSWGRFEDWEHGGVQLHGDDDLTWCVAGPVWILAFGKHADAWATAVVDRIGERTRDGLGLGGLPRAVERRLPQAPPGLQGCGAFDAGGLFGLPLLELFDLDDELGDVVGAGLGAAFGRLRPFLAEHGLEQGVALIGWDDGRWRHRVLW